MSSLLIKYITLIKITFEAAIDPIQIPESHGGESFLRGPLTNKSVIILFALSGAQGVTMSVWHNVV